MNGVDIAIEKVGVLIMMFKTELPQSTISSMLAHMTDRKEVATCTGEACNSKPKHIS